MPLKKVFFVVTVFAYLGLFGAACAGSKSSAQLTPEEAAYRNSIGLRAYKIVAPLQITDSAKFYKVRDMIAGQYIALRDIDAVAAAKTKAARQNAGGEAGAAVEQIKTGVAQQRSRQHEQFLAKLSRLLTAGQVNEIKDGMTYGVLPITYKAYEDMIPALKADEKKYILETLTEAREKAMDGGSSDEKHAIFGKYKGRINNYLSQRGYDLTKERAGWNDRIEAAKKKN